MQVLSSHPCLLLPLLELPAAQNPAWSRHQRSCATQHAYVTTAGSFWVWLRRMLGVFLKHYFFHDDSGFSDWRNTAQAGFNNTRRVLVLSNTKHQWGLTCSRQRCLPLLNSWTRCQTSVRRSAAGSLGSAEEQCNRPHRHSLGAWGGGGTR